MPRRESQRGLRKPVGFGIGSSPADRSGTPSEPDRHEPPAAASFLVRWQHQVIGKETRLDRTDVHLPERLLARCLQDAEFAGYGPAQLDQAAFYLLRSPNMREFMEEAVENEQQARIASQLRPDAGMFVETEQTDDAG